MGELKSTPKAKPSQKERRDALEEGYKLSFTDIPETVKCASCGLQGSKNDMERHHPAGRRKDAFLFYVLLHPDCHRIVHEQPELATLRNLLWKGRNSRVLTLSDAVELVQGMPHPPFYAIEVLKKWKQT